MTNTTHDDGNWNWHYECKYVSPTNNPKNWHYECKYVSPTNNPKDWYYTIGFDTKDGGYLNDEAITCYYWQTENLLQISKSGSRLDFYTENFYDIEVILKPLIKAYKANPYKIYESITKERKDKINKINKNGK